MSDGSEQPADVAANPKRPAVAVIALIVGIVALVVGLIPFIGLLSLVMLGPAGVIVGIVAVSKTGASKAAGRGFAIAGLVLSAASMVIAVSETAYINYATNKTLDATTGRSWTTMGTKPHVAAPRLTALFRLASPRNTRPV